MQDDQTNKPVDDLAQSDPPVDSNSTQAPNGFSLGTNPSSIPEPPADTATQPNDSDDSVAAPDITPTEDSGSSKTELSDDLVSIRKDALAQLSPIVDELDQPPEERYRTLMMLIQATDDQALIKSAYEAANKIEETKIRAEALLSIVNEINYFAGQEASKED